MARRGSLSQVVAEVNRFGDSDLGAILSNEQLRRSAIDSARQLTLLLQTPEEAIRSLAFSVRPIQQAYLYGPEID